MRIVVCGNQQSATDAIDKAYVVNHLGIFSNKYLLWWIPAVRALQIGDVFYQSYTKIKKSLICFIIVSRHAAYVHIY